MPAGDHRSQIDKKTISDNLKLFESKEDHLTSDDYYTPPWFFKVLDISFDLDVASPIGGCHWIPAKTYYDPLSDGLSSKWFGRVFMNPPFSHCSLWSKKFVNHRCGVAILPMTRAHWFNELWQNDEIKFAIPFQQNGLFKFLKNGKPTNIFMPVIVLAMGKESIEAIKRIGYVR
jgi:hypothetical protein